MDSPSHDLNCDPTTRQLIQSPANTAAERADARGLCYTPETSFRLPSEERRLGRPMHMLPGLGVGVLRVRTRVTRSPSRKR